MSNMDKKDILLTFWKIYEMNGVTDALKWLDVVKYDIYDSMKNADADRAADTELANILTNIKLNDMI